MLDKPTVFAITINYCHPEITLECVNSLRESKNVNLEIIIVDNASPDDSVNILKELLPKDNITLIKSSQNKGFSAGNNLGIKYALSHNAEFILLINNDTVVDPDMVSILQKKVNKTTVVAPKIYYYENQHRVWFAGGKYIPILGKYFHIGEGQKDSFFETMECDWLTGCCVMFKSETIRKTGMFDEIYFMYMEDVDYSLRLKNNGVKLIMVPEAHMWHKVSTSSGVESKFTVYYSNRNRLYLQKKFQIDILTRLVTLLTRILLIIKGVLFNTNQKYIAYAVADYFRKRMNKQNYI